MKTAKTATQKHKAFHNLGNVFMKEKNYTEAVEAYKNALRNNPSDDETRYNYALAKKMLKENPPKDDKDKKDDKKDKDKDKDKKDQDKKDQDKKDDKKDGDKDKKDDKKDGFIFTLTKMPVKGEKKSYSIGFTFGESKFLKQFLSTALGMHSVALIKENN